MSAIAYYNDSDKFACQWLRELIKAGLIAPGEVDERSIEEVKPEDLRRFTQCHFFAGIGVWSYALRLAGWPDDRPVWTGSCPCPSFSAAGQGKGFEDPRHLWPCWFGLIGESRPPAIFGEQADKAIGFGWLDLVQTDLEAQGYAVGATVFGAHSVGAPHIRQRLYFVADSYLRRPQDGRTGGALTYRDGSHEDLRSTSPELRRAGNGSNSDGGNASTERLQRSWQHGLCAEDSQPCDYSDAEIIGRRGRENNGDEGRREHAFGQAGETGDGLDTNRARPFARQQTSTGMGYGNTVEPASGALDGLNTAQPRLEGFSRNVREWRGPGWLDPLTARSVAAAGATRGFWSDCDWWYGRDGKYRPIGQGISPLTGPAKSSILALAPGATDALGLLCDLGEAELESGEARTQRLRGYGNAVVAQVASAFIEAYMSI